MLYDFGTLAHSNRREIMQLTQAARAGVHLGDDILVSLVRAQQRTR